MSLSSKNNIACSNNECVEGATHRQVVELIKQGGDELILLVISDPYHDSLNDSYSLPARSDSPTDHGARFSPCEIAVQTPFYRCVSLPPDIELYSTRSLRLQREEEPSGNDILIPCSKNARRKLCGRFFFLYSNNEPFSQVFNIHMAGRHLCSRRYSEFVDLHNDLKMEFHDYNFPKLPGKWPFALNEQRLDQRRRGLEQYLEKGVSFVLE